MKTKTIIFIVFLSITGCENGVLVLNEEDRQHQKNLVKERAIERKAEFKLCMELSAKITRTADDDVSDIIDKCSSHSYYITMYIK